MSSNNLLRSEVMLVMLAGAPTGVEAAAGRAHGGATGDVRERCLVLAGAPRGSRATRCDRATRGQRLGGCVGSDGGFGLAHKKLQAAIIVTLGLLFDVLDVEILRHAHTLSPNCQMIRLQHALFEKSWKILDRLRAAEKHAKYEVKGVYTG